MSVDIDRELTRYYRHIGKNILGTKQEKKMFLQHVKNDIAEYREQHPTATYKAIQEHFGEPEQIGREYIAALDEETVHRRMSRAKAFKIGLIVVTTVIILTVVVAGIVIVKDNAKSVAWSYDEEISYLDSTQIEIETSTDD